MNLTITFTLSPSPEEAAGLSLEQVRAFQGWAQRAWEDRLFGPPEQVEVRVVVEGGRKQAARGEEKDAPLPG